MLTNQQGENGGEEHKNQGLDEAHEQLEKIERDRQQPPEAGDQFAHGLQHVLSRENVSIEAEAQRDRPEQDRNELQAAGGEEDNNHERLQEPGILSFGAEQFFAETDHAHFADG